MSRWLLAWSVTMVMTVGLAGTPARAQPFTGLVVLGDSLSDQGNAGRFTDGLLWVERLADGLGLPLRAAREGGSNFAVGGARVTGGPFDLGAQAGMLLAGRSGRLDPGVLYVAWAGANDLLGTAVAPDRDRQAAAAAAALGRVVDRLAAAGAVNVLVPNLPDIGAMPALRAQGPAWAAEARRLSRVFNDALEVALVQVERQRRMRFYRLDVFALGDRVQADPERYGFTDVTRPCRGGPCGASLFWDEIHPTATAHARLADAALRLLGVAPVG